MLYKIPCFLRQNTNFIIMSHKKIIRSGNYPEFTAEVVGAFLLTYKYYWDLALVACFFDIKPLR